MQRILPEQISRFFLFDGELLQEYEDLLSSESDMGRRISEAIERILGVPVLTNARATLLQIKDKSEQRVALAAQGDQKTREFGSQLADLHGQRRVLNADLVRHEHELEELRTHKASLEDAMRKRTPQRRDPCQTLQRHGPQQGGRAGRVRNGNVPNVSW
jgi:chromosome segregation ATPase